MQVISFQNTIIQTLVDELAQGKTFVYPTETCYGLGCDATNEAAVAKVFAIKGRDRKKSVLMVVPDTAMIERYVDWNQTLERLARRYWPGPLTIVLPVVRPEQLASGVMAEDGTAAFRVSSYPFLKRLTEELGQPLVSTSANLSGEQNPYSIADVVRAFKDAAVQPDMVIDAGVLPPTPPTTIVRVAGEQIDVIRQGEIIVA